MRFAQLTQADIDFHRNRYQQLNPANHFYMCLNYGFRKLYQDEDEPWMDLDEAANWCAENIGPPLNSWFTKGNIIGFIHYADALAFKMRWC